MSTILLDSGVHNCTAGVALLLITRVLSYLSNGYAFDPHYQAKCQGMLRRGLRILALLLERMETKSFVGVMLGVYKASQGVHDLMHSCKRQSQKVIAPY